MIGADLLTDRELEAISERETADVNAAWTLALADPYPEPAALLDRVYAPTSK